MTKIAVFISGRGSNLHALIDVISKKEILAQIVLVVTNCKEALGLKIAEKHNIASYILENILFKDSNTFISTLSPILNKHDVELICLAGFMRLLPANFVNKWQGKIVNIHPSLLPSFKGLNAQMQALKAGVKFSGCTVHYVTEEVDAGEIIAQAVVPIFLNDNVESLSNRILKAEHKCYPLALKILLNKTTFEIEEVELLNGF